MSNLTISANPHNKSVYQMHLITISANQYNELFIPSRLHTLKIFKDVKIYLIAKILLINL
jgi:hypothetical protein